MRLLLVTCSSLLQKLRKDNCANKPWLPSLTMTSTSLLIILSTMRQMMPMRKIDVDLLTAKSTGT